MKVPTVMHGSFDRNQKFYVSDKGNLGCNAFYDFVALRGSVTPFLVIRANSALGKEVERLLSLSKEEG